MENINKELKKLSIIRHTYGIGDFPIISLNYHNTKKEENLNFFPNKSKVDIDLVDKICEAIKNGYKIDYNDDPTGDDLK